jgi:8-oxo-dGTP pyrophosphatase MutT (NUDIX family)
VVSLDDIRAALGAHVPRSLTGRSRAAVALVLHEAPSGPEVLFIERATRFGDPWSGHMAFPGGRVDPGDVDVRAAAMRETREEVGLDLTDAEGLGRLSDLDAGIRVVAPLVLSAFVYRVDTRAPLVPNHEVREALWVPVSRLVDPVRHVDYRWGLGRYPGIVVGEPDRHVVWGLTYRLVDELLRVVGVPLPAHGTR